MLVEYDVWHHAVLRYRPSTRIKWETGIFKNLHSPFLMRFRCSKTPFTRERKARTEKKISVKKKYSGGGGALLSIKTVLLGQWGALSNHDSDGDGNENGKKAID